MSTKIIPRPLFLYGTLRALPLLAWALTGDSARISDAIPLTLPATLTGFARFSVFGKDYPALVRHTESSIVDGLLLWPQTQSQRRKLDDFEGECYTITPIMAIVDRNGEQDFIDAEVYMWNGDTAELSQLPWDIAEFTRDRLDDWLDLFSGMELIGDIKDET